MVVNKNKPNDTEASDWAELLPDSFGDMKLLSQC